MREKSEYMNERFVYSIPRYRIANLAAFIEERKAIAASEDANEADRAMLRGAQEALRFLCLESWVSDVSAELSAIGYGTRCFTREDVEEVRGGKVGIIEELFGED